MSNEYADLVPEPDRSTDAEFWEYREQRGAWMDKEVKVAPYGAAAWSNSDGRFGIAIVRRSNLPNGDHTFIEVEMTPDELVSMATDMLLLAQQKRGR